MKKGQIIALEANTLGPWNDYPDKEGALKLNPGARGSMFNACSFQLMRGFLRLRLRKEEGPTLKSSLPVGSGNVLIFSMFH
jgi:hypothetical protein